MSIYLRGGIWWAYITKNGKRTRLSLRTGDMHEARRLEATLASQLMNEGEAGEPWKFSAQWITKRLHMMRYRSAGNPDGSCMTRDEFMAMIERSKGRCELTGIPFSDRTPQGCERAPFAPSVDRIDHRRGYTADNCRLVCLGVNVALNQWGEVAFRTLALGFLGYKLRHTDDNPLFHMEQS